jgi:hypothetical protein
MATRPPDLLGVSPTLQAGRNDTCQANRNGETGIVMYGGVVDGEQLARLRITGGLPPLRLTRGVRAGAVPLGHRGQASERTASATAEVDTWARAPPLGFRNRARATVGRTQRPGLLRPRRVVGLDVWRWIAASKEGIRVSHEDVSGLRPRLGETCRC